MRAIRAFMLAGLIGWPALAPALPLNLQGDPDQFRRDIDEINRRPLPGDEQLARAVGDAVTTDARRRGRCQPKRIVLGKLEPVTLDGRITASIAAGQVENGWLVSARLDDCPPADPIRVLVLRLPDNSLQGIFAGQGETLAWPTLSRDLLRATAAAAVQKLRASDPACAPADMTPTGVRVVSTSPDLGPSQYGIRLRGSWHELWTFEPCGHRVSVPVTLRTNGTGGAYWDIDQPGIGYSK